MLNAFVTKNLFGRKQEVSPAENQKPQESTNKKRTIKGFFQNKHVKNVDPKPVTHINVEEALTSNSLAKIWDIRQLRTGIETHNVVEKQSPIGVKRENSIELNEFNDFSRIDFNDSEDEQKVKKEFESKFSKRSKRSFGGKIEKRTSTALHP